MERSQLDRIIGYVIRDQNPEFSSGSRVLLGSHHVVPPVLQSGPTCGLVSIVMAAHLLQKDLELRESLTYPDSELKAILDYAKQKGLSKQGEMFSVEYMKDVVASHFCLEAHVVDTQSQDFSIETLLVQMLNRRAAILVPYDADRNHSPCMERGYRAHWCILVGICVILDRTGDIAMATVELLAHTQPRCNNVFLVEPQELATSLSSSSLLLSLRELVEANCVYVFARQGKSSHLGLWSLQELLDSNRNLIEVHPDRCDPANYVLPKGGIREGLQNKILVIKKDHKNHCS